MARTRAASSARDGSTSTRARSVARFTSAPRTPATPRRASSTLATHDAHVMPVTTRSRCVAADPKGGLETGTAGRAATRAFRRRRAALTTHEHAGRVGVDLFMGLRVEARLPAAVIAHFVARASGSRDQPEADEAHHDEDEGERIHQRRVSPVARSERAMARIRSMALSGPRSSTAY